ncbi:DinB family protein [Pelagibacterium sp. 26DY04]|uniref:DinB family protein n=1 Tax=Pelagibacterium sp. 26DY04 TaxID=2967130 RepID=UPI002814F723|nr:DinB family protein [Pelagibacterium sp. 26DY04]WMT86303.1 DinB family protein [Pelagibacterium sp. 26DY04]
MITPDYARTMARYNAELNRRIYGAALRLSDEQRREDCGAFWGSIHGTLNHLLWADRLWLSRFGIGEAPGVPIRESGKLVGDFDALWAERQAMDETLIAWADGLTTEDLGGELSWHSGATGRDMTKPRDLIVVQIFNHQTHHRGQVHALITRFGEKTGDTDLPFVLP